MLQEVPANVGRPREERAIDARLYKLYVDLLVIGMIPGKKDCKQTGFNGREDGPILMLFIAFASWIELLCTELLQAFM
jgi:hypothetical protein